MSTRRRIAFLFPGQGAQYPGMGKDFFDQFPQAKEAFEEADDLLGRKLSDVVFHGTEQELTKTRNSQLGIYVNSIAILRVLHHLFPDCIPAMAAGLSLGEYSALTSSGALPFEEGVKLVSTRAEAMNEACEAVPGAMAVILGLDAPAVDAFVKDLNLKDDLWVANYNCPGQIVISGTHKGIEAGVAAAKAAGAKRALPLQVHGAFHSGLMRSAEERLTPHIMQAALQKPQCLLYMNVSGSRVEDVSQMRLQLAKQVTNSVCWEQSMRAMETQEPTLYLEIGCGKALTGFHKRIGLKAPCISIEKVEEVSQLEKGLV